MAKSTSTQAKTNKQTQNVTPTKHHYVRTTFASLFGVLALVLLLLSTLAVGVQRAVTDTKAFTAAVGPAFKEPELQKFVADEIANTLLKDSEPEGIAAELLPESEVAGKTPEQLREALKPVVAESAKQVLSSDSFTNTVTELVRTAHADALKQIKADSGDLTINFTPLIDSVLSELKKTKLSKIGEKIEITSDQGKVTVNSQELDNVRKLYDATQQAILGLFGLTALFAMLCVFISVHHMRTLRRVMLGSGIVLLLVSLLTRAPSAVPSGQDAAQQKAAVAVADALLGGLQTNTLIIGLALIIAAVASKVYEKVRK
jgi:hypothetical protein